ncbi:YyaL domain-containing protein [Fulvitalea axinellae]
MRQYFHLTIIFFFLFFGCGSPKDKGFHFSEESGTLKFADSHIATLTPLKDGRLKVIDKVNEVEEGIFLWERTVTNIGKDLDSFRTTMEVKTPGKFDYGMIPGLSYNGNPWGDGNEPKTFTDKGLPWVFSYNRTSVPGATYSENDKWTVALFSDFNDKSIPFSCSLMPKQNNTYHRLIWPEEETPRSYSGKNSFTGPYARNLSLKSGQSLKLSAWVVLAPKENGHGASSKFLDFAWKKGYRPTKPEKSAEKIRDLSIDFIKTHSWSEEGPFKGFRLGLKRHSKSEGWGHKYYWRYETGFCGQNISLANAFLYEYISRKDKDALEKGLESLDIWARDCSMPNGLFRCHYDQLLPRGRAWEAQDACNLGTASYQFFEAFELAKKCGVYKPNYKDVALAICDFMISQQEESGRLGKYWNNKGECLNRNGTTGAFLIPGMIKAFHITEKQKYLDAALKAFDFYFGQFQDHGYTVAGALGTNCVDKESSFPLLRSAMLLHKTTQDKGYLEKAERLSQYLASWQWHYDVRFPEKSFLAKSGYRSTGATSVSAAHNHLDHYALVWVSDWVELAKLTGNDIWLQRAQAIWHEGNSLVSDGKKPDANGDIIPAGGQFSTIYQANWAWSKTKAGHGSGNVDSSWLPVWYMAYRLETLRKVSDWSVLDQSPKPPKALAGDKK